MQPYQFFDTVVLRTPAFSYDRYANTDWQDLLQDKAFLAAIGHASPVVYNELKKIGFSAEKLTDKLKKTLTRYFNRMCYRPTPFATMASLSITHFNNSHEGVFIENNATVHSGPDFRSILQSFNAKKMDDPNRAFITNASIYETGKHWRYLFYEMSENNKRRNFQIVSIAVTDAIRTVIELCTSSMLLKDIITTLAQSFNAGEDDCHSFVLSLIERQVLLPADLPGVTGYASILGRSKDDIPDDRSYIISERNSSGGIPAKFKEELTEALSISAKLSQINKSKGLEQFKKAFRKKYDLQAVPLLTALDPEVGVGYQELASSVSYDSIIKDVPEIKKQQEGQPIEWSPIHSYLLSKWADACDKGVLHLDATAIERFTANKKQTLFSPSCSVIGKIHDDQFFIEHAGGISALPLLGRFTVLGPSYAGLARSIAKKEEEMNPAVLFAEVVHFSETHTANVERRFAIRDYEIPIVTSAAVPADNQIQLGDLWVKLEVNTIVLWSAKHNKRVIPRLSSAFNYQRSDLSVFRFLCDLQHQEVCTNLSPSLQQYFPGQSFYPRLQYKNIVFQPATWIMTRETKTRVFADSSVTDLEAVNYWLTENKCPRYLCVSEQDNQIVVDTERTEDMVTLVDFFKDNKQLTLSEFPFAAPQNALIKDANGNNYINQVVLSLYNSTQVYAAPKTEFIQIKNQVERQFLPGSDWLYFKIYCLPMRANELLVQHISPLVQSLREQRLIKSYFFVRITEDGFHIRLRFLLTQPGVTGAVMEATKQVLKPLLDIAFISKVQTDTYERELERYSEEQILRAERFFCHSSDAVLHSLKHICNDTTDVFYYRVGFAFVKLVYEGFEFTMAERLRFSEFFYKALSKEYDQDPVIEQKARDVFRQIGTSCGMDALMDINNLLPDTLLSECKEVLSEMNQNKHALSAKRIYQLANSLLHLHLNRLFTELPRLQELIVYYCVWRYYIGIQARLESMDKAAMLS